MSPILTSTMWMTWIDLIKNIIIGWITNSEILILRISLVSSNNLIESSITLSECDCESGSNRRRYNSGSNSICLSTRSRWRTRNCTSIRINTHTWRERRRNGTTTEAIGSGSNLHLFRSMVKLIGCLWIINGRRITIVTNKKLKLIHIGWSCSCLVRSQTKTLEWFRCNCNSLPLPPYTGSIRTTFSL